MGNQDKIAIVTGGTKGIGRGVTIELLKQGFVVIVTYSTDTAAAEEIRNHVGDMYNRLLIKKVNHSCKDEIYSFCQQVKERYSKIDVLVCNAGKTNRKPYIDQSDEEFEQVMQVSLYSHNTIIRELFPLLNSTSRIVFIGSMMAIYPHAVSVAYGVAKAAVHALALNLVKEFDGLGTTVNVVAPGFVETEWQQGKSAEIRESIYNKTAAKRFATIEEIVGAVNFCISNAFVNGSVIEVSGGYNFK